MQYKEKYVKVKLKVIKVEHSSSKLLLQSFEIKASCNLKKTA